MTLKALTIVVLRLFAIQFFAQTIIDTVTYVPQFLMPFEFHSALIGIGYPMGFLSLSIVLWLVAQHLAALATKGIDGPLPLTALTLEDLYCFAFLVTGLNYVLGSISTFFNELYRTMENLAYYSNTEGSQITPLLLNRGITVIFGLAFIFGARVWSRKLLRLEQKNET